MMITVIMLMYTVSLKLQLSSHITIHNQCLNTELASLVCFGNGAVYPKLSHQKMHIGIAMKTRFEINATQDSFEGALLYKLEKHSEEQSDADTLPTEVNRNATHICMLIAWKVEDSKSFVHIALIEHAKEFTWNKYELKKLYNKNRGWLKEYDDTISDTWVMDGNMVLKTIFKIRGSKGSFGLSIFISEEERDDYAMRPLHVDPERQVALETLILFILILLQSCFAITNNTEYT
jgi:hypothetical protein